MTTTASALIARSVSHNETVFHQWSQDLSEALSMRSNDSVEANDGVEEFWGVDDDGNNWRVHLTGNHES